MKNTAFSLGAERRALLATIAFSIFGTAGFLNNFRSATALPLFVFYELLTVNTYFSIRCFSTITAPDSPHQKTIDAALAVIYGALAVQIGEPFRFYFTFAALCLVATLKYKFLQRGSVHQILLGRKISVDILGALFSALVMLWSQTAYAAPAIWLSLAIFALANYLMLITRPFYVLQNRAQIP